MLLSDQTFNSIFALISKQYQSKRYKGMALYFFRSIVYHFPPAFAMLA